MPSRHAGVRCVLLSSKLVLQLTCPPAEGNATHPCRIETPPPAAARDMERGKAAMMLAAVLLWLLGFGALAFLLCCPWLRRVPPEAYTVLLCVMGVAFGWAGTLFVGGFVGRGVEAGALRQQAAQLGVLLQRPGGLATS